MSRQRLIVCALCLAMAGIEGCKGRSPTLSGAASKTVVAGRPGAATKAVFAGKLAVTSAEVGAPNTLLAWLFGPLESETGAAIGTTSAVDAQGNYSFPTLAPGTYHLQFGHTWASPHSTKGSKGQDLRTLDFPVKITPNSLGTADTLAANDTTSVTIGADGTAVIPAITVTAEPFTLDWDTSRFVPKAGQALPNQSSVEFNIVGHVAARDVSLVVHAGSQGAGAEVFKGDTVSGRLVWHGSTPGKYSYQTSCTLPSSKVLQTAWNDFSVAAP
jgi:hypothetical protein